MNWCCADWPSGLISIRSTSGRWPRELFGWSTTNGFAGVCPNWSNPSCFNVPSKLQSKIGWSHSKVVGRVHGILRVKAGGQNQLHLCGRHIVQFVCVQFSFEALKWKKKRFIKNNLTIIDHIKIKERLSLPRPDVSRENSKCWICSCELARIFDS